MAPQPQALGQTACGSPRSGYKANAIERVNGRLVGAAADPRSEGVAMGETGTVTHKIRAGDQRSDRPE